MPHTKLAYVTFRSFGMLAFAMGNMVPVPEMRSFGGRDEPTQLGRKRPNSFAVLRVQILASSPFSRLRSDANLLFSAGTELARAAMWCEYCSSTKTWARYCVAWP